jgi:hypothetical protein
MNKLLVILSVVSSVVFAQNIPLPEHPRPDFYRNEWLNLNGKWDFRFDKNEEGLKQNWSKGQVVFNSSILVPFPWGAPLSGIKDEADVAWYKKTIDIPANWSKQSVFVVIGASDYKTTVWIDGILLGNHEGGYTPFEFELPINKKTKHTLVIRVDDTRREYALYGKQGYGNARGIWQTIYLEARPSDYLETLHFTPDLDNNKVSVTATLPRPAKTNLNLQLKIGGLRPLTIPLRQIAKGQTQITFDVPMPNAKLWTLENPFLYEVEAILSVSDSPTKQLKSSALLADRLNTYFGMRKISVVNLPNTNFKYVALNNKPIYLQLALDQSYHPEGFYTFPTDEFMKNEIQMAKDIGLNGIRTHIKIDVPRKLYWADRLGLLVMSDLPNFWGNPDPKARAESERTLPELIKRDFNHPAIFSWILFNETWGLTTTKEVNGKKKADYLPETQKWVAEMYHKAKVLDPTRLVEDNSVCCGRGHTETDINSWHEYLPGYGWEAHLKNITNKTFSGSTWNFEKGYKQADQPNINSEFGNVWGYEGSTGDVDWSWDYHKAINEFRRFPQIAGWLYTEHHDVINEWNGYWKFDRTQKETGLGDLVSGMTLKDLHSDFYVSTGQEISKSVTANQTLKVPLSISVMTGRADVGKNLTLKTELYGWNGVGEFKKWSKSDLKIDYQPFMQKNLDSLLLQMPNEKAVAILSLVLKDEKGTVLHRNFMSFIVEKTANDITLVNGQKAKLLTVNPKDFADSKWSQKQWNILDGLKVNGAGSGFFEYKIKIPADFKITDLTEATFIVEASAKQLFGKDRVGVKAAEGDFMLGGGTNDPTSNPNSYQMTDETKFASTVTITINGELAGEYILADDPADHRGILSWHNQPRNNKLSEAGSYGYKIEAKTPKLAFLKAIEAGEFTIRLSVAGTGGLAIYGQKMGRYPFDPTIILK